MPRTPETINALSAITTQDTAAATRRADPMRGILDKFYAGIHVMIPAPRARQPREEEMKCGSQPADIRMIHRRSHCPCVALPLQCQVLLASPRKTPRESRERHVPSIDSKGHIRNWHPTPVGCTRS